MSDISKGLINMRFHSLVGYQFLRKLEGKDLDEVYTEEIMDLSFDAFEQSKLKSEKLNRDPKMYIKVIVDEYKQGNYANIEMNLDSLESFAEFTRNAFDLSILTNEECATIIKPLFDALVESGGTNQ